MSMRKLTKEELNKLKPTWATHYRYNSSEVLFESKNQWCATGLNFPFIKRGPFKQKSKLTKCKPIPAIERKPFDITKHELFKSGILTKHKNGRDLHVNHLMWRLDKDRAIAIAKALGVTGADLL